MQDLPGGSHILDDRPTKLRVEACTLCQLRCAGCSFQRNRHADLGGGWLKFDDFSQLVDENPYIREIELSNWGEIFLNPHLVQIMRYAHEKGVKLTARNGVNFNTASEEQLRALVESEFRALSLSIDGASQQVYA